MHIFVSLIIIYLFNGVISDGVLTPQDEFETSQPLNAFLDELDIYSGLSSTVQSELHVIESICDRDCIVNVNGSIVWEVRSKLYNQYLYNNLGLNITDEGAMYTLDGCLNSFNDTTEYNGCMETVRTKMLETLITNFDSDFREILEINNNCENVEDNCVT
ncbi:hypothetical protein ABEB36_007291 [Hypothenemus hampei]|uniref:Uncharacterized protein n=1 Tax=Hypothenemus hampei TaxID=57062 RepID=A0ABD1EWK6_HYPHA